MLDDIFSLDVDVLTVDFTTLVEDTEGFLARLAYRCRTAPFDDVPAEAVNVSTEARFVWLSTLGWFGAVALRRLGLTRLLQRVKDSRWVDRVFFNALASGQEDIRLDDSSVRILDAAHRQCWSLVTALSEQEQQGLFIRRSSAVGP